MKQTAPVVFNNPCIRCGKPVRADYMGLCMDCADVLGISEINNPGDPMKEELSIIYKYKEKNNVRAGRNNPRK